MKRKLQKLIKRLFVIPIYEKRITKLEKQIIELEHQRDWLISEKAKYKNANKKLRLQKHIMNKEK